MQSSRLLAVSLPLSLVLALGCAGDGTGPNGNGNGNGTPTLSGNVQPIFTASCAFGGCHGSTNTEPSEKPQNLTAGNAWASIVNVSSSQVPTMDRVEPGDPDNSYLVHKIEGTAAGVGGMDTRMPLGMPVLSTTQINTIRAWITAGALNN